MEDRQKNNRVLLIGFGLIFLVGAFTFLRPIFFQKKEAASTPAEEKVNYPEISPLEAKAKIKAKEKIAFVDVRNGATFQEEHIIDSLGVADPDFNKKIPANGVLVLISDVESAENLKENYAKLKSSGYEVFLLTGGIAGWKDAGGTTISWGDPRSFGNQAKVTFIAPEQLKTKLDTEGSRLVILDIRGKTEFASGHLINAQNIPLAEIESSRQNIPSFKEVIVYGDTELSGFQAGVQLFDLGFLNTQVMSEGFTAWKQKGFPVE